MNRHTMRLRSGTSFHYYYSDEVEREIAKLQADVQEARDFAEKVLNNRTTTCIFCGHEYPPGTPAAGGDVPALVEHMKICPKHPVSSLTAKLVEVRQALGLFRSIADGGENVSEDANEIFCRAMSDDYEWPV